MPTDSSYCAGRVRGWRPSPGVRVTKALYANFYVTKRFDLAENIAKIILFTFIFARCPRSSAAVTPVKYERDVVQVTNLSVILRKWENNGTEEIGLVTPTPDCAARLWIAPTLWILYMRESNPDIECVNNQCAISQLGVYGHLAEFFWLFLSLFVFWLFNRGYKNGSTLIPA